MGAFHAAHRQAVRNGRSLALHADGLLGFDDEDDDGEEEFGEDDGEEGEEGEEEGEEEDDGEEGDA
eukprot:804587-Pleurochrysis_carterae.AAC.2